ncbi:hypothetical protein ADL02_26635 [Streptomyces sp. NRRL WC-3723]|nr:hypothetical protein ADL02_26635 [Streptomyces sp. NRRL WC-3723]
MRDAAFAGTGAVGAMAGPAEPVAPAGRAASAGAAALVGTAALGAAGVGVPRTAPRSEPDGWLRAVAGAGRVNQTTLPFSPSGRAPQLSLTAATMARPRPQVASGVAPVASVASAGTGRRGSWSRTDTVSRSGSSSSSTVHDLSGLACRWTLLSSSVTPSAARSINGSICQ